jgi:hypothetical protein
LLRIIGAIQLDGATGKLHIERRRSDIIEKIHDGSIVDDYFKTGNGFFKLFYTTVMGLALFTIYNHRILALVWT